MNEGIKVSLSDLKHGDKFCINGYEGEVVSVTGDKVEILYGGEALHYSIVWYENENDYIEVIKL